MNGGLRREGEEMRVVCEDLFQVIWRDQQITSVELRARFSGDGGLFRGSTGFSQNKRGQFL